MVIIVGDAVSYSLPATFQLFAFPVFAFVGGAAVLIILHDLNSAAQYADKILLLKDGKISAFDTPEKVFMPETIHETFGVHVSVIKHPHFDCPPIVWRDYD